MVIIISVAFTGSHSLLGKFSFPLYELGNAVEAHTTCAFLPTARGNDAGLP